MATAGLAPEKRWERVKRKHMMNRRIRCLPYSEMWVVRGVGKILYRATLVGLPAPNEAPASNTDRGSMRINVGPL